MTKKKLKAVQSISVEDALDQIIFPKRLRKTPPGILTNVWRRGHGISPGVDLAWYRGHHAGIYDAFLTLQKAYPVAAKQLREAFGMDEHGRIGC